MNAVLAVIFLIVIVLIAVGFVLLRTRRINPRFIQKMRGQQPDYDDDDE